MISRDILRIRVELTEIPPPIWRELLVPAAYSFWDLHVAIQDSTGWLDYHQLEAESQETDGYWRATFHGLECWHGVRRER